MISVIKRFFVSVMLGACWIFANSIYASGLRCYVKAEVRDTGTTSVSTTNNYGESVTGKKKHPLPYVVMEMSIFSHTTSDDDFFSLPCISGQYYSSFVSGEGVDFTQAGTDPYDGYQDKFFCRNDKKVSGHDYYLTLSRTKEGTDSYENIELVDANSKKVYLSTRLKGGVFETFVVESERRIDLYLHCGEDAKAYGTRSCPASGTMPSWCN